MIIENFNLSNYGIWVNSVYRNPPPARLYEWAVKEHTGKMQSAISSQGALIAYSGKKTGRSPHDKRIVKEASSENDVWWGSINIPLSSQSFEDNLSLAKKFLNTCEKLYIIDAFAGWRKKERLKVRIICARPYHALFMHNMLIQPNMQELDSFGDPDWTIYNAGQSPANITVEGVSSESSIDLNFEKREIILLGTEYAGCMKKGVFTVLNYLLPKKGILPLHSAANEGSAGDVALFLGLSGTGKTTLSTDPERALIGDDEHGWDDDGLFNFEGGCYAKVAELSHANEPGIWNAIRFGSILENVVYDSQTRKVDYFDTSITENTRVAYPLNHIAGAKIPALGSHPKNIIFLTCDAFGVLPPISSLNPEQAMYYFLSGYSAKTAGTEEGITDPVATFSACFGAAFMVHHPLKYAELLRNKMNKHGVNVWLINTGWTGGAFGVGQRIPLNHTRSMIDAALRGSLNDVDSVQDFNFNLKGPASCPGVPNDLLTPKLTWDNKDAFETTAKKVVHLFKENFEQYHAFVSEEVIRSGPK